MSTPLLTKFYIWPPKLKLNCKRKNRIRGVVHTMTTILVLGKIKKENMINHHPRVPKTHLLGLIRLGLLMKLLILLKVQGQVL